MSQRKKSTKATKKQPSESKARKTSSVPTLVFEIGGGVWQRLPSETRKSIQDEIFAAHLYQVSLVKIENAFRARKHEIRMGLSPRRLALDAQYQDLEAQLAALRAKLKSKAERVTPAQRELLQQIDALKTQKSTVVSDMRQEKAAVDELHDWRPLEKEWLETKVARIKAAALERGKTTLAPNDGERHRIVAELYDEFLGSDRPAEWLAQLAARREAESAEKRARNIASKNPPPGIVQLSPGTYQAIESAVEQAKKDTIGLTPLNVPKFQGGGRLGVQLTDDKGVSVGDVLAGRCERLSIEVLENVRLRKAKSDEFHPSHSRPIDLHAEERKRRAELYAREPHRRPYRKAVKIRLKLRGHVKDAVFLELDAVMHRPLPEDAVVKWVHVAVDRVGYDYHLRVLLTIESHLASPGRVRPNTGKRLAVNFGWRVEGHQIRIATTWDGTERRHYYLDGDNPPPDQKEATTMQNKRRRVKTLLGHADDKFNAAICVVRDWLGQLPPAEAERLLPHLVRALPRHTQKEEMTIGNITSLMSKWRDHRKLLRVFSALRTHSGYLDDAKIGSLWQNWKQARLHNGRKKLDLFPEVFADLREWLTTEGVDTLDAAVLFYGVLWRAKEIHLVNWSKHQDVKLVRRRLDRYRKLAHGWAQGYDEIVTENWDKSRTAQTPKYEEDLRSPQEENANAVRQFVGISKLGLAVRSKFGSDHRTQSALDITSEHFGCGGHAIAQIDPDKPGLSATPDLECDKCHSWYDQDTNAARHLWHRAFDEGSDATGSPGGSSVRERSGESDSAGASRKSEPTRIDSANIENAAE